MHASPLSYSLLLACCCLVSLADVAAADVSPKEQAEATAQSTPPSNAVVLIDDDFSQVELPNREFQRGTWTVKDGMATAISTKEEVLKYNRHGPKIRYNIEFTDVDVLIEFKVDGCDRAAVGCTANATIEGKKYWVKAFAYGALEDRVAIHTEPHPAMPKQRYKALKREAKDKTAPQLPLLDGIQGRWVTARWSIRGEKVRFQINDAVYETTNPTFTYGMHSVRVQARYGTISVRKVLITRPRTAEELKAAAQP